MKKYIVGYHKRGKGKSPFNNMVTTIEAKNTQHALKQARKRLAKHWVVETARRK